MTEPSWVSAASVYDTLFISIERGARYKWLETLVTIEGSLPASRFDVKEAQGTDGASIRYKGLSAARPTLSWQLWTLEHEIEWLDFLKAALPRPGKTAPVVITAIHPELDMFGLTKFWLEEPLVPKFPIKGICEVGLKLLQWSAKPKEIAPAKKPLTLADYAASLGGASAVPNLRDPTLSEITFGEKPPPGAQPTPPSAVKIKP